MPEGRLQRTRAVYAHVVALSEQDRWVCFELFAQRMANALYVIDAHGTRPREDGEPVCLTRDWYIDQLRLAWDAASCLQS